MTRRKMTGRDLFSWLLLSMLAVASAQAQPPVLPPLYEALGLPEEPDQQPPVIARVFRFEGNTVFTNRQLFKVIAGYYGRPLSRQDLEAARVALTRHYIENGYINSGAVLDEPAVIDGVATFTIVEGVLSDIRLNGNDWLADHYVVGRLRVGAGPPLNVLQLKNQLELLRENPNIKTINAQLHPGPTPGDSLLDVAIEEDNALHLALRFDNARSPSIGAERFSVIASHTNLTGHSDSLSIDYGVTKNGLDDIKFSDDDNITVAYTLPISAHDTTLGASFAQTDSLVVEEPFADLNISSELKEFKVSLRHPFYRSVSSEFAVTIAGERRENETFLESLPGDDDRFSFSQGPQDGVSDVTVLRIDQEFFTRDQQRAVALLSSFRIGLDALDATIGGPVDGRFFSWLGQFQYVQRLGQSNLQALFRVSSQLADSRLLSLEQFALGGVDTVRGYRHNQVVRDNGVALSGELRAPLLIDANGAAILTLVPFIDFGYGWDSGAAPDSINIASTGVGLLLNLDKTLNAHFYWGYPFRDFDDPEDDIQDLGIHFRITWFAF